MVVNWNPAREVVADVFFADKVDIYLMESGTNEIGEETESGVLLLADEPCNVQNGQMLIQPQDAGLSAPQGIRISLRKDIGLDSNKKYEVEIKQARIKHTDEHWAVSNIIEGQISTVLNCSRVGVV